MKRLTILALLAAAAATAGAAYAREAGAPLDRAPSTEPRFERPPPEEPAPRWNRQGRVECAPAGPRQGFEAEIDREFSEPRRAPPMSRERRVERSGFRLVGDAR